MCRHGNIDEIPCSVKFPSPTEMEPDVWNKLAGLLPAPQRLKVKKKLAATLAPC